MEHSILSTATALEPRAPSALPGHGIFVVGDEYFRVRRGVR